MLVATALRNSLALGGAFFIARFASA